MKKLITLSLSLFVLGTLALGQTGRDPNAKKILDASSAKFKTLKSFQATASYDFKSSVAEMNETFKVTLLVEGDKYCLKMDNGMEIYHDGESTWTYSKDDNECTIYGKDNEEAVIDVEGMVDMYKSGYKYVLTGEETVSGRACHIIDLEPDLSPEEHKANQVYKIRLHVDKSNNVLRKWKIFEKNGNRYTVTVSDFKQNIATSAGDFVFHKEDYPGVYIEDLR